MDTSQEADLLEYMLSVSRQMIEIHTLEPLLHYLMQEILPQVGAERGYIILKKDNGRLEFKLQQDRNGQYLPDGSAEISHSILNHVLDSGQGLILSKALTDPKFRLATSVTNLRLQSVMCVPLITQKRTIGAIYVENRSKPNQFNQTDLALLELFANQGAAAIENAYLHHKRQQQLNRQEKLAVLGQLADGVGNELRNPLGIISNAAYFLEMVLADAGETTQEYLQIIAGRVREAEHIVANLLNLSRSQSVEFDTFSLAHIISTIFETQPPPAAINITSNLNTQLPPVRANYQHIRQTLENVLVNAYEAMPGGGTLNLTAMAKQEEIELMITDTGPGMTMKTVEKVFDPLFTTKAKSIGLGLAVAKNLIKINGGDIRVKSTKDKGSTFTVILPITPLSGQEDT